MKILRSDDSIEIINSRWAALFQLIVSVVVLVTMVTIFNQEYKSLGELFDELTRMPLYDALFYLFMGFAFVSILFGIRSLYFKLTKGERYTFDGKEKVLLLNGERVDYFSNIKRLSLNARRGNGTVLVVELWDGKKLGICDLNSAKKAKMLAGEIAAFTGASWKKPEPHFLNWLTDSLGPPPKSDLDASPQAKDEVF